MDDMSRSKSPLKTAYDRFMESEGIPIVEGWYVADVRETERRPWKRLGGKGAFIQLYGQEDITALYVVEILPGRRPQKRASHVRGNLLHSRWRGRC
jgi:hypothetical protein